MIDYDLIIITKTIDERVKSVTQHCIDSCLASAEGRGVNVILVETGVYKRKYKKVDTHLMYKGEFRYNRALNLGLEHRKGKTQMLANNDLIFQEGWANTGELMDANGILSASILSNDPLQGHFQRGMVMYEGYGIARELAGWLIFTDARLYDIIGKLPENQIFWFSDNDYADTLKANNIPHFLLCHAEIVHLGSNTLKKVSRAEKLKLTFGDTKTYKTREHEKQNSSAVQV